MTNGNTTPGATQPLYARDLENADQDPFDESAIKARGTPKCVRVIVVCIYLFTVSFAALLLSAYYIFFWEPTIDDLAGDDDNPQARLGCEND